MTGNTNNPSDDRDDLPTPIVTDAVLAKLDLSKSGPSIPPPAPVIVKAFSVGESLATELPEVSAGNFFTQFFANRSLRRVVQEHRIQSAQQVASERLKLLSEQFEKIRRVRGEIDGLAVTEMVVAVRECGTRIIQDLDVKTFEIATETESRLTSIFESQLQRLQSSTLPRAIQDAVIRKATETYFEALAKAAIQQYKSSQEL